MCVCVGGGGRDGSECVCVGRSVKVYVWKGRMVVAVSTV